MSNISAITTLGKSRKRWHLVLKTIFCSRVLLSLVNNAQANEENTNRSCSPDLLFNAKHAKRCFKIDLTSLILLVKEKNLYQLQKHGWVDGVTSALEADIENGTRGDGEDIAGRHEEFGLNKYEIPPVKTYFRFLVEASKDVINFILFTCAALSFGFGIKTHGLKEGWRNGGSIFAGIFLTVSISAARNFRRSRQFDLLSKVLSNDLQVDVVRNGPKQQVSMSEILVGDVICFKLGDQVPADGLYLGGRCLQVDELSLMGQRDCVEVSSSNNPFLLSGTKVCMVEGNARMLVTSVGNNTILSEIMSLIETSEKVTLPTRLNNLTSSIFLLYCVICTIKNLFSMFHEDFVCIFFLLDGPESLSKLNEREHLTFADIYLSKIRPRLIKNAEAKKQYCTSYTIDDNDNPGNRYFRIDQTNLAELSTDKNFIQLQEFGGIVGITRNLDTDVDSGIRGGDEEIARRLEAFGSNKYEKRPAKSFLYYFVKALKNPTIIFLLTCASVTFCVDIRRHGLKEGWYNGGSIYIAVFLDIAVTSISNFRQNKQLDKFTEVDNNRKIDVVRAEKLQQVSALQIVVGDVICLKIGDLIPADGLFSEGLSLRVDESMIAWHCDLMEVKSSQNPFLFSGTKVVDGYARMLVTSVGINTVWAKKMSQINENTSEHNLLQARLNKLTSSIIKVGLLVASKALLVLLALYFRGKKRDGHQNQDLNGSKTKVDDIVNAVVGTIPAAVSVASAAFPEGLPSAFMFILAYSTKRMMAKLAMVRNLHACETLGSATTICASKTGNLMIDQMKVTKFWLGQELMEEGAADSLISLNLLEFIKDGVARNSTCNIYGTTSVSDYKFLRSPTEEAILSWAVREMKMDIEEVKRSSLIINFEAFNSRTKRSGVMIKKPDNIIHVHWKGAAEIILAMCSNYYNASGIVKDLDDDTRKKFEQIIQDMAASSLRCIAFAHKLVSEEELEGTSEQKKLKENGLSLLGLIGINDPCPPEVRKAVADFQLAGVNIKMITDDNVFRAKAIATECGILDSNQNMSNEAVVEGEEFRNYTPEERMEKVDKICVMARSSPSDSLLMVQCLKQKGHVIAVAGNSINDAPAMKEADIGLATGIHGASGAQENSHFIILDGNFASVATIWRWGRCIHNSIHKFIHFKLTGNLVACVINFVTTVSTGKELLTEVELLWMQLIMDTLGALALSTELPSEEELIKKPPVGRTKPFVTKTMWRNLLAQALYQITVLLTLLFKGESIFGVTKKVKHTMIFNSFVLCQVLNLFNKRINVKKNAFKWIGKNKLFLWIVGMIIVLQWATVELSRRFIKTESLVFGQWVKCIGIAAVSWLIACLFDKLSK